MKGRTAARANEPAVASPELVFWEVDPETNRIVRLSRSFETVYGMSLAEAYASREDFFARIHPGDLERIEQDDRNLSRGAAIETTYRFLHPDGRVIWIRDVGAPTFDEHGKAMVMGIARDVTAEIETVVRLESEVRDSEARYRDLLDQLEQVREQERQSVAAEVHDDIGSLLTGILLDIELCGPHHGQLPPPVREALERVRTHAKRAHEATRRIAASMRPALLDHAGLEDALRALVRELRPSFSGRLSSSIANLLPAPADPVATELFRVAQELLANALRHARATHIAIRLRQAGARVRLEVKDDGPGRTRASRRSAGSGLDTVRERARRCGGHFEIGRGPGGTRAVVDIPWP